MIAIDAGEGTAKGLGSRGKRGAKELQYHYSDSSAFETASCMPELA